MKKVFISVICAMAAFCANAQDKVQSGYHGYVDLGYTVGVGDYEFGRFELSTTHGYQVCPYFFVGVGVGFHFMSKYETPNMEYAHDTRDSQVSIPLFADFRGTFSTSKFAPFIDAKLGHFVTNGDGFYASASVGVRMRTAYKQAVSLSIGYTYEKLEFETFSHFTSYWNMDYTRDARKSIAEGISIKLGYEF